MTLQFKRARLERIGGPMAVADKQWATLSIGFLNDDLDHFQDVEIRVAVPKKPDATLSQIEDAARESALEVLKAAVVTLSGESIAELERRQAEIENE